MEANIAEFENQSRRNNICIINLPEKIESSDVLGFVSSSLPKWFPTLSGEKMELMRAHHIVTECTTGGSRTLICKMLRYNSGSLCSWSTQPGWICPADQKYTSLSHRRRLTTSSTLRPCRLMEESDSWMAVLLKMGPQSMELLFYFAEKFQTYLTS